MTSLLSSLFGSSAQAISSRIETMRSAEKALISFAHRFADNPSVGDTNTHTMQLFDTSIQRSEIPLKNGKGYNCQMLSCCKEDSTNDKENNLIIHGIQVTRKDSNYESQEGEEAPLVLLHGYMNGALYFYRNLIGLADHAKSVYALDMLGWGLSSRPPFDLDKNHKYGKPKNQEEVDKYQTDATEQVFVESLEAWRKAHNIPKMILAGHSMGGYMSVAYCEKYPERVERLILISPAGVPDDQNAEIEKRFANAPLTTRALIGLVRSLFNSGITPPAFVRKIPESRGRNMVNRYIEGRLPAITCPEEQSVLGEYLYTNAILPGSGEDCLSKVLKPTAFARKPTLHRIPHLKVKNVSFLYGQNDWMDPQGGVEVLEKVEQMKEKKERDNQSHSLPSIQVLGVKNAGHLLMLENWQEFNSAMAIALGRQHALPSHVPLPYQYAQNSKGGGESKAFFHPPRWERKQSSTADETTSEQIDVVDENAKAAPSM